MITARINRKKFSVYAMDIESHNDLESIAKQETSMWLGCLINDDNEVGDEDSYFYTMPEFINRLEDLSSPKRKENKTRVVNNIAVYIYNLSFEWSFLLPELLKRGYVFKETIEKEDEFVFNSISTKSCSSVWQVNLKASKRHGTIILRDLAKIFGGGLGNVAKAFNLPTQKGEIDYRKNRLHNYTITQEEKEYCFKDTRIIIDILLEMNAKGDKDFWNSISMASYSMRKLLKRGWPRDTKPYMKYRESYPELGEEETRFLREGVEGGITYAPSDWQYLTITKRICHIDAHQMHPSSAFLNLFPYGEGEYFTGEPLLGRICCCRIRISYDDVILHSIIKLIGLPFIEDKEIVVWDFEIPTMYKCYVNLRVEYIDGYAYKMKPLKWRRYYADNYSLRLEAKARGDAFFTLLYKLWNNSSYGKHLEKPHNVVIENTIREDGIIDSLISDKEPKDIKVNAKYTYIPAGSCIPAYSRVNLIETAFKLDPTGKKILYFDTDSIFFLWDKETEANLYKYVNMKDELGGWAIEEFIDRAQFTAPKRYKTETNGKTTIKAGGINFDDFKINRYNEEYKRYIAMGMTNKEALDNIMIPFDEINIVSDKYRVQRAYRVKGGTIIEFQEKEVSIPKKYIDIYEKNVIIKEPKE